MRRGVSCGHFCSDFVFTVLFTFGCSQLGMQYLLVVLFDRVVVYQST